MPDVVLKGQPAKEAEIETRPDVSILILNLNKTDLTLKCVESVQKQPVLSVCEIIVVDNGSIAEEAQRLKQSLDSSVRFISLKQNMFFGEGNNIAAEAANGKFLVFLNNDVTFAENVVDRLLIDFRSCFAAGALGPRFLYPDGKVQEAGAFIRPDGSSVQQGMGELTLDTHFGKGCHIVDYCSAACLMVERTVFLQLGGFDPLFDPAYYEDSDLCLRMRSSMGLYTYFSSETTVYHEGNATSATLWPTATANDIISKNRQTFLTRWGRYLERRLSEDLPFPAPVPAFSPRPRFREQAGTKGIVLCSSSIIVADDNSSSMLRCAAALQEVYNITFAAPELCSRLRIRALCSHLGIKLDNFSLVRSSDLDHNQYDHILWFGDERLSGPSTAETLKAIFRSL